MRRRLITFVGVAVPLALVSICVIVALLAAAGWWLGDDEEEARIIRIVSLAPLTTPQTIQAQDVPQEDGAVSDQPVVSAPVEATPGVEPDMESLAVEGETSVSVAEAEAPAPEELEQAPGSSLPAASFNSFAQEDITGRLVIPSLNLDAPIIVSPIENQTWKVDHLGQAIGHLEGTASPGSDSNFVLAGHVTLSRDVFGPFVDLQQLTPGDVIYVYEDGREFQYVVDAAETVDRTAVEVTHPTSVAQITLITCSNWDDAVGRYADRYIVKGYLGEG